jgi:CheY-like chemotaxis protein
MGHALEMCMPGEELWVHGDPVRLTQVISNIMHNAAKYTPPGGRIEVYAYREGGDACVRVVDNGIGIDEAMLPRVFDLFAQAPGSLDRSQGGLGIGLTLVKSLVELHGGRVVAESAGPGKGSAFTVKLPLSAAEQTGPQPPATTARAPSTRSISMLVVDDNRDAADTLAEVARSLGHRVGVAYGGLEALQIGPDLQPQLVVLDIGMPEMDGYELARRLRRVVRRDAVFVALSGYGTERDRTRSREAGFDDHLVKPLTQAQLTSLIARTAPDPRPAAA